MAYIQWAQLYRHIIKGTGDMAGKPLVHVPVRLEREKREVEV